MRLDVIRRGILDVAFVVLAAVSMGTLVAVANFADYGPLVVLDVGATTILTGLGAGIALGLVLRNTTPQYLVLAGFLGSCFAVAIVFLTVYAPVLAGVVPGLEILGSTDTARLAIMFTSLFLIPIHVVGCVVGYALADFFAPAEFERGGDLARTR